VTPNSTHAGPLRMTELEQIFSGLTTHIDTFRNGEFGTNEDPVCGEVVAFASQDLTETTSGYALEAELVSTASQLRTTHFVAGRSCAHRCLDVLGVEHSGIGRHDSRAPRWPESTIGAITHTEGFAAAAVCLADPTMYGLGIDAEQIGRVDGGVARRVMNATEASWVAAHQDPELAATVLFGAKESFYKAQWPITRSWVGFEDVEVEVQADTITLRPATSLAALAHFQWPVTAGFVVRNDIAIVGLVAVATAT
jgi:4'-phosphopantetheinyl transferase EntD